MTRENNVSIIVGSLILGLLKTMDFKQQSKGSTINYTQLMKTKIAKEDSPREHRKKLSEVARDSMLLLVEQFKDETAPMMVATFVETMSFSFEKELTSFYGQDYMPRMIRFTEKQIVDSSIAPDSYRISDQLRDNIRKIIFDRL